MLFRSNAAPLGTGITNYNVDSTGAVQTPLPNASKGDEMILVDASAATTNPYWRDTWSHATCVGSITDTSGDAIAVPDNGVVLVNPSIRRSRSKAPRASLAMSSASTPGYLRGFLLRNHA